MQPFLCLLGLADQNQHRRLRVREALVAQGDLPATGRGSWRVADGASRGGEKLRDRVRPGFGHPVRRTLTPRLVDLRQT